MANAPQLSTALADRYRIERELGAGGMATVYLARDLKHEREVALKVLRPELGAVLGADRFLAEIKITARLDHPHILTLIDSGAADGFLYYVLPYVRGESLRDLLNREKQLGLEQALAITRQVASALDYAHRQGVVHRDIKPENILLQEGEAMLADFGIALAVKEAGGNRLTETGLSLGTPQYMSPEQATGDRTLDARSDVYSLAAVLYEMLAGEPPVTGPTVQAVIAKLLTERPTHLRVVRDTVPEGIDAAVAKALAKVPADRFVGAGEFVAALGEGGRGDGGTGGRGGGRRATVAVVATVAIVVAVAAGVVAGQFGRGAVRVVQPDRVQVTTTGNARAPGLSPDGQRLAYATRRCSGEGYCTVDVVVQDVGGAGTSTVLRGWAGIWDIDWSEDGRFLLVHGFQGQAGNWGPFAVPSLGGGAARFLGCCEAEFGLGDTVLVMRGFGGDTLNWVRWVTIGDGVAHDSLPLPRRPGWGNAIAQLRATRLLVVRREPAGQTALVLDRDGTVRDSLVNHDPARQLIGVPHGGRALLATSSVPGAYVLLAHAIGDDGRLRARAETVLTQGRGGLNSARSGEMLNATGPVDHEVWVLRREQPHGMRFTQRRLAAGTARLGGLISPQGDRVMMGRRVTQGGRDLLQWSLIPADSGAEVLVGLPLDIADWEWSAAGTALIAGVRRGDSVDVGDVEVPSGRFRARWTLARPNFANLFALGGGGVVVTEPAGSALRILGSGLRGDTTLTFPERDGSHMTVGSSPDGRALVSLGWEASGDSVLVRRVELGDGRVTRLAAFYADGWQAPHWYADGTLLLPIRETGSTLVWYRMPASGGRPVRLGTPPRSTDATLRLSADGRVVVARVVAERPDIYIIRNFAELLPR